MLRLPLALSGAALLKRTHRSKCLGANLRYQGDSQEQYSPLNAALGRGCIDSASQQGQFDPGSTMEEAAPPASSRDLQDFMLDKNECFLQPPGIVWPWDMGGTGLREEEGKLWALTCPVLDSPVQEGQGTAGEGTAEGYKDDEGPGTSP
ncbi:hypothetical protein llap_19083 [Limosa lapponica baueri]|uniref:Uncharacterized protein n=1 Tax=Limosa lapponica baueri TaxID=1758121 RepID=A0A2I0TA19_LIMLA|nr:hypothetical protein llap_19083 [Limosa lapponica baueri]